MTLQDKYGSKYSSRCWKADGREFFHEHADHHDFKFTVQVDCLGPVEYEYEKLEVHALIYTDGHVAVTMYEYCYAMWSVGDGKFIGGNLWNNKYQLSEDSTDKISSYLDELALDVSSCGDE